MYRKLLARKIVAYVEADGILPDNLGESIDLVGRLGITLRNLQRSLTVGIFHHNFYTYARLKHLTASHNGQLSWRHLAALPGWYRGKKVLYSYFRKPAIGSDPSSLQTRKGSLTRRI